MPRYTYVALDARGQESIGLVDAGSTNEAIGELRRAGYFPTDVYEEGATAAVATKTARQKSPKAPRAERKARGKNIVLFQKKTVKPKVMMIFTRQLSTLIDAGLPLLRGLNVLAKQERDAVLKTTINKLADSVQGGTTFSEGLAQHPRLFNDLYVNMVKAGELGGVLEVVLTRLAEFQEKAQKIKNKVVAAMVYPLIVLVLAVAIMTFLLVFIVPKFEAIFHDMLGDKPLPAITLFVINVSNFVQNHWEILLGVVAGLIVAYKIIARSQAGKVFLDRVKLRAPLFGDLIRKTAISRFSRTLGTLVTSGVPILQALNITRETAGNSVIARAISQVHDLPVHGTALPITVLKLPPKRVPPKPSSGTCVPDVM